MQPSSHFCFSALFVSSPSPMHRLSAAPSRMAFCHWLMQLQAALPFSLLRAWKDCFLKMQSSPLLFSPQVRISEHVGVVANGPESPIVPVYGKPVDDVAPLGLERQQEVDPIVRDDE